MRVYELVLDGKLSADVADSHGPIPRRDVGNSTVLSVPATGCDALAHALALLQDLGIGLLGMQMVDLPAPTSGVAIVRGVANT